MDTHLEYRHSNGYDYVLLVDSKTMIVRSDWRVDRAVAEDFCDCSQDASDWDDRGGDEHRSSEYGELIATRIEYSLIPANANKWRERIEFMCH